MAFLLLKRSKKKVHIMTEQRKNGQNIPRGSGAGKEPHVIKIPLRLLDNFPKHPYYVFDDDDMLELMESIRKNGLIFPLIVRRKNDRYELISGHRRKHACELLGHKEIACRIVDVTDDEAIIMMVDSNCQRTKLLPSERAYAYKMKLEAMKRQGKRSDLTSVQLAQKLKRKTSRQLLAEQEGQSQDQIRRYKMCIRDSSCFPLLFPCFPLLPLDLLLIYP